MWLKMREISAMRREGVRLIKIARVSRDDTRETCQNCRTTAWYSVDKTSSVVGTCN